MTELAKAGLSVRDSLAGARGVLQLSAAAQIGIADATELSASALNAFQLAGGEAVHVADLLANAANNAQGSISDMGLALRQSAAVAKLVGISLEGHHHPPHVACTARPQRIGRRHLAACLAAAPY